MFVGVHDFVVYFGFGLEYGDGGLTTFVLLLSRVDVVFGFECEYDFASRFVCVLLAACFFGFVRFF